MVDKAKVREDYINGFSVRMLAAKYGVPKSTVNDWIRRYGWSQEQDRYVPLVDLSLVDKPDTGCPDESDSSDDCPAQVEPPPPASLDYTMLRDRAQKVLAKADQLLEIDDALAPRDLKSLSSMLLDIRQLLNVMGPYEEEERRLRIALARKQIRDAEKAEKETEKAGTVVRFVDTEGAEE